MFNYYLQYVIEFCQEFDPTETLMMIANDPDKRLAIFSAPDTNVPLSYVLDDLWVKLGFLPIENESLG